MFYQWVSAGAIFGIEAFFAVFMFCVCVGAALSFMIILGAIAKKITGSDKN